MVMILFITFPKHKRFTISRNEIQSKLYSEADKSIFWTFVSHLKITFLHFGAIKQTHFVIGQFIFDADIKYLPNNTHGTAMKCFISRDTTCHSVQYSGIYVKYKALSLISARYIFTCIHILRTRNKSYWILAEVAVASLLLKKKTHF